LWGIFTYRVNTMTEGRSHVPSGLRTGWELSLSTMIARPFITKTRARLKDTTERGSYPAFNTSVRMLMEGDSAGAAATLGGVIASAP
jgi:hypothetical protein